MKNTIIKQDLKDVEVLIQKLIDKQEIDVHFSELNVAAEVFFDKLAKAVPDTVSILEFETDIDQIESGYGYCDYLYGFSTYLEFEELKDLDIKQISDLELMIYGADRDGDSQDAGVIALGDFMYTWKLWLT